MGVYLGHIGCSSVQRHILCFGVDTDTRGSYDKRSRTPQLVTSGCRVRPIVLAVLGATFLLIHPAWASFDEGLRAAKNGRYEKAMEFIVRPLLRAIHEP